MDWKTIIQELLDSGLSQERIAELVGSSQSHISGLFTGKRKQPGWEMGNRILSLHKGLRSKTKKKEAA